MLVASDEVLASGVFEHLPGNMCSASQVEKYMYSGTVWALTDLLLSELGC